MNFQILPLSLIVSGKVGEASPVIVDGQGQGQEY